MFVSVRMRPATLRKGFLLASAALLAFAGTWAAFDVGGSTQASTATGNLTVQIQVTAGCAVGSATLDFGPTLSSALVSAVTGSTSIAVTCTNGTTYSIGLDNGANALASQRRLTNGSGSYLNYQLFTDISRTVPWTAGSTSTTCVVSGQCITGTGTGAAQNITVYGSAIAVLPVAAGNYSDTVTMTVTY